MLHFRCDTVTISDCIKADTLTTFSCWKSWVPMKTPCIPVEKQFTQVWVYNSNGRSFNQPCTPVPYSMGQTRYKDTSTKTVIIKMLNGRKLLKFYALQRKMWYRSGNLWGTLSWDKNNTKSKGGDGLSDSKPKWKYYNIMSFIDITLLKSGYATIYLPTSLTYTTYINTIDNYISILIRSIQKKTIQNHNCMF